MKKFTYSCHLTGNPEKIWLWTTDSDFFNQISHIPKGDFKITGTEEYPSVINAVFKKLGLVVMEWEDTKVEWVYLKWFRRERDIKRGPLSKLFVDIYFCEKNRGFDIEYSFTLFHGNLLGKVILLVAGPFIGRSFSKFFKNLGTKLKASDSLEGIKLSTQFSRSNENFLKKKLSELSKYKINEEIFPRIEDFLLRGSDDTLQRIRPLELSTLWNIDKLEVLRFFLLATKEGLFNLNWDIHCPNCRGTPVRNRELLKTLPAYHCDTCKIDFETNFDESVEVTFTPHEDFRKMEVRDFCYGYPALTPHVLAQVYVEGHSRRKVDVRLNGNDLHFWVKPLNIDKDYGVEKGSFDVEFDINVFDNNLEVDVKSSGEQGGVFNIYNNTDKNIIIQIQKKEISISRNWISASYISTLQDFRDLFSSEILLPEVKLSIKNLTFIFTDLKESTKMYDMLGDAKAFSMVFDHFEVIREIIRKDEGAIVKTIGDAVMGVFSSSENALRAAFEIQKAFLNKDEGIDKRDLVVKMGLHRGPCIAITLNDRLDYFGSTVNVAARVQKLSKGEDFILTDEVINTEEALEIIKREASHVERFNASLKGLRENYNLYRVYIS